MHAAAAGIPRAAAPRVAMMGQPDIDRANDLVRVLTLDARDIATGAHLQGRASFR